MPTTATALLQSRSRSCSALQNSLAAVIEVVAGVGAPTPKTVFLRGIPVWFLSLVAAAIWLLQIG